jgi:hypothetical protein
MLSVMVSERILTSSHSTTTADAIISTSKGPSVFASWHEFIIPLAKWWVAIQTQEVTVGREIKTELRSLHCPKYRLTLPLPIVIEICGDDEFIAMVADANISMSGDSATEALDLLRNEIIERYESYTAEKQLKLLEKYIAKTGRKQTPSARSRRHRSQVGG